LSVAAGKLGGLDLRQTLAADVEVPLASLKFDLLKSLEDLQPTGYGNLDAVFVSRDLRVTSSRTVGAEGKHLKLVVTDGRVSVDAIGFRLGHLQSTLPPRIDIIYTFESNEYNGRTSLQLNLKDLKPSAD
jgi:single-stranded-DNA-specific exonuclease